MARTHAQNILWALLLTAVLLLSLVMQVPATNYYAKPYGVGGHGRDSTNAFNNLEDLTDSVINPGDTGWIMDGTYTPAMGLNENDPGGNNATDSSMLFIKGSGDSDDDLVFKGAFGKIPVLDGVYYNNIWPVVIEDQDYIKFDSIEIKRGLSGFTLWNADYIKVYNSTAGDFWMQPDDGNSAGVLLYNAVPLTQVNVGSEIVNCSLYTVRGVDGGDNNNACGVLAYWYDSVEVSNTVMHDFSTGYAMYLKGDCNYWDIHDNQMWDGSRGIQLYVGCTGNKIYRNQISGFYYTGITLMNKHVPVFTSDQNYIYNNTLDSNGMGIAMPAFVSVEQGICDSVLAWNNIFSRCGKAAGGGNKVFYIGIPDNNSSLHYKDIYFDYNCFYDFGSATWEIRDSVDYSTLAEWQAGGDSSGYTYWWMLQWQDANSFDSDPIFTDRDNRDFNIPDSSPAASGLDTLGMDWMGALEPFVTAAPVDGNKKVMFRSDDPFLDSLQNSEIETACVGPYFFGRRTP